MLLPYYQLLLFINAILKCHISDFYVLHFTNRLENKQIKSSHDKENLLFPALSIYQTYINLI